MTAGLISILMVSAADVIINRDGGLVTINLGAGRLVRSPAPVAVSSVICGSAGSP